MPAQHREVVRQQLQGHDVHHRLQAVLHLGHPDDRRVLPGNLGNLLVALGGDEDEPPAPGAKLLHHALLLRVAPVPGGHDDEGHRLVHERERAVLHLPGEDTLRVHQRNLLNLERTLQRGGVVVPAAEHQQALLILQIRREREHLRVELERRANRLGEAEERLHDFLAPSRAGDGILGEREREEDHGDDLAGVRLGGRDANLRARVDVDTAVGAARDGRADGVDDADAESASFLGVLHSLEGIRRLTRLGDEDAGVIPEEGALAVEDVGGELEGDGEFGELLHELPDGDGGVVGGAAAAEDDAPGPADGADKVDHTAQEHALGGLALIARHHAPPHGLDH